MQFIYKLLQNVAAGGDANKAAKDAYAETLSHHHSIVTRRGYEMGLATGLFSTDKMLSSLGPDKVARHACLIV